MRRPNLSSDNWPYAVAELIIALVFTLFTIEVYSINRLQAMAFGLVVIFALGLAVNILFSD